jgi:hypothetical protein
VTNLPRSLQLGIFDEMHRDIIAKVPILQPLTAKAVFAIARCWNKLIYLPEDEIVKEGAPVDNLYFVVRGTVGIKYKVGMMRAKYIDFQPGDFFGEECSVECRIKTSFLKLQRGNLIKIADGGVNHGKFATIDNPNWKGFVNVKLGGHIRCFDPW